MNKRIQKIKNHYQANTDLYFAYAVGVTAGVVSVLIIKKTPKVPKAPLAQVITAKSALNAWHQGVVASGKHVFLLNDVQKQMWQDCWAAAQESLTIKNPDYIRGLSEGFQRAAAMSA